MTAWNLPIISGKKAVMPLLDPVLESLKAGNEQQFLQTLESSILTRKVKFPVLEFIGIKIWEIIGPEKAFEIADKIAAMKHEGGYVVIGKLLQLNLPTDFETSFQKAADVIAGGGEWYVCDIISERVFGKGLLMDFEKAFGKLQSYVNHPSSWVKRAVGISVHLAVKRRIDEDHAKSLLILLMQQAETTDFNVKKGVGWGIETIAKFYPDLADCYRERILDNPKVNVWIKRKYVLGMSKGRRRG